jgi:hypothetical protein
MARQDAHRRDIAERVAVWAKRRREIVEDG